jgi:hypothetical protein
MANDKPKFTALGRPAGFGAKGGAETRRRIREFREKQQAAKGATQALAEKHTGFKTLEPANMDRDDFKEVSVDSLHRMVHEAGSGKLRPDEVHDLVEKHLGVDHAAKAEKGGSSSDFHDTGKGGVSAAIGAAREMAQGRTETHAFKPPWGDSKHDNAKNYPGATNYKEAQEQRQPGKKGEDAKFAHQMGSALMKVDDKEGKHAARIGLLASQKEVLGRVGKANQESAKALASLKAKSGAWTSKYPAGEKAKEATETGPKGGRYYISGSGQKVYIK